MDIQVALDLDRDTLVAGERTQVAITLTNTSARLLELPDIRTSASWPKIRVRDLQTGKDTVLGPMDLAMQRVTDPIILPQIPLSMIKLAPKAAITRRADLMNWIGELPPGRYDLAAVFSWSEVQAQSPLTSLRVEPAHVDSADTVTSDSGYGPIRHTVWSSSTPRGASLLFTSYTFDPHGHPICVQSFHVADLPAGRGSVAVSVTPNRSPFPNQWLVWFDGQNLARVYLAQSKVAEPLRMDRIASARLIGPVFLEIGDNSQPGAGHVVLWRDSEVTVDKIEPSGALSTGPSFPIAKGLMLWARGAWLSTGERRFLVATGTSGATLLQMIRWSGAKAGNTVKIGDWPGTTIGGGMTLSPADQLWGALVLRGGGGYSIQPWRIESDGRVSAPAATSLVAATPLNWVHARIAVSAQGSLLVTLESADHQWFWSTGKGIVNSIPPALNRFGIPIDGFWLSESSPFLAMAGPDTGITYQAVTPH